MLSEWDTRCRGQHGLVAEEKSEGRECQVWGRLWNWERAAWLVVEEDSGCKMVTEMPGVNEPYGEEEGGWIFLRIYTVR